MTLEEWFDGTLGRPIDVDGSYGAQCVDLVNDYLMRVWSTGRVHGNAIDIAHQQIRGFVWEANGPRNAPPAGAIVVWNLPPYGHTAVALWSTAQHLITLDQNWNGVGRAETWHHDYHSIVGWHRRG